MTPIFSSDFENVFKAIDLDKNGKLSFKETAQADYYYEEFNEIDTDGNFKLSMKEVNNKYDWVETSHIF